MEVVQDRIILDVISSKEFEGPKSTPVVPERDLGIYLKALAKPPYEFLPEASLKDLSYNMVFL